MDQTQNFLPKKIFKQYNKVIGRDVEPYLEKKSQKNR